VQAHLPVPGKYRERNFPAFVFKGKWFEMASQMAQFTLSLLFLGIPFFACSRHMTGARGVNRLCRYYRKHDISNT